VVRYDADYPISEDDLDCPCSNSFKHFCPRPGQLSFYVNGYLKHRVLPVSKGERYSLVSFFDVIKKNKNTMI
jgi:hypothetical protein